MIKKRTYLVVKTNAFGEENKRICKSANTFVFGKNTKEKDRFDLTWSKSPTYNHTAIELKQTKDIVSRRLQWITQIS